MALRAEPVFDGLHFPTSMVVTDDAVFVAESGLPFGGAALGGRVWEIGRDGARRLLVEGLAPPVTGLCSHDGGFFVSEGGAGRILRLARDGATVPIVTGLPGPGNYHTNTAAVGPDGLLYFGQGAMTNTGVVGLDAYELGWLRRLPHAHDIPGYDIVLSDAVFETDDPVSGRDRARTSPFQPFGVEVPAGTEVTGEAPCTAAVMRCRPDGTGLELVAWGLRNPFGLGFLPDGRLLAVDQGADDRGSRPVGGAPDLLYEVRAGAWYGWPDYIGGDPVTDEAYLPRRGSAPGFVLAEHHRLPPPEPARVRFPPHTAAVKFAVAPERGPGWPPGGVVVALFGDERPMTAPEGPAVGRTLVHVDPADWSVHPMPPMEGGRFLRPIDVAFDPRDGALLVLDFGAFEMTAGGVEATAGTGRIWRVKA